MKTRLGLIIGLIVLTAVGSSFILSEKSDNLVITIETNGSDVEVKASSPLYFFANVPHNMMVEINNKALSDVESDTSTVETIKTDVYAIAQKYGYNAEVKIESQFGTDQLPMTATVRGTSMVPTLQDGQSLVVLKTKVFKVGDIVVARHPSYGLIVKRVSEIKNGQVFLKSDNREIIVTDGGILKGLDAWIPVEEVVGVVKVY